MNQLQNFVLNECAAFGTPFDAIMLNFHLELRGNVNCKLLCCKEIMLNCLFIYLFGGGVGGSAGLWVQDEFGLDPGA